MSKTQLAYDSVPFSHKTTRFRRRSFAMDEAIESDPAEPKSRGIMAVMARLAARCTPEEWAQLHDDFRGFAGGAEAEDDQVPQGLAVDPDTKTTDLPLVSGMDRIMAADGRPAAGGKLNHAGLLKLAAHIKTDLY
jgi:hypothetical protein